MLLNASIRVVDDDLHNCVVITGVSDESANSSTRNRSKGLDACIR